MSTPDRMVFLVDDDPSVRETVKDLLEAHGLAVMTFGSSREYLGVSRPEIPACLVLDVKLPDINGLDLQQELSRVDHPPIVFITGYGDVPSSVRAMKSGAVDFLPKPFTADQLMAAVRCALEHDASQRVSSEAVRRLRSRYDSLTAREREVLGLVVSGLLNKQSAAQMGIAKVTFQIHRRHVMRKMAAGSLSELVRMATTLGIPVENPTHANVRKAGGPKLDDGCRMR